VTLYFFGDFETAPSIRDSWYRDPALPERTVPVGKPRRGRPTCLCYEALCAWHFGEIAASQLHMVEAIASSKELNDMHGLASTLYYAGSIAYLERDCAEVECFASDVIHVIELSTRHHFAHLSAVGSILRGWACSASGGTAEGVSWIEDGI